MSTYPYPGPRWAYDLDGTIGFVTSGGLTSATQLTSTDLSNLNREKSGAAISVGAGEAIGLLFPVDPATSTRDLPQGLSTMTFGSQSGGIITAQTTSNSVSGADGSWSTFGSTHNASDYVTAISATPPDPIYRTFPFILSFTTGGGTASGIRIVFANAATIQALHLFVNANAGSHGPWLSAGNYNASGTLLNGGGSAADFGDTLRGNAYIQRVRLTNQHSTKTANSIVLAFDSPTGGASGLSEHDLSIDGGSTWGTTKTITSLGPGVQSGDILVRRTVGATAAEGPWINRMTWAVTSWT